MLRTILTRRMPMKGLRKTIGRSKTLPKSTKPLKSKQLAVTTAEKAMWTKLAECGCIACIKDGRYNPHVSIHHIDGRTKPGCHKLVLPLCGPHHQQDDGDPLRRPSVHGRKATFTALYGTEKELLAECLEMIGEAA